MNLLFRKELLFIFCIVLGASCQHSQNRTTIIENVRGYTFYEGELEEFSSIAFRQGKIVDVAIQGPLEIISQKATVIDGEGRVMLPGLIDAHGHVMGLGYKEIDVDLSGTESLPEVMDSLSSYASEYPELSWIRGRGWNHTHWAVDRFPTAEELNEVVNDRPVWLERVDGHAGWANSKAMELAGITAETEAPGGGKIIRYKDGTPTGIFIDKAMDLIESEIPQRTPKGRELALTKALQQMRVHGLTSVHDAGIDTTTWALYKQFADQGKMTTRIYAMISGTGKNFKRLADDGPITSYGDDLLALRSIKVYADGALGSRGAALLEPYNDDPDNSGLLFLTEQELNNKIAEGIARNYQVNIHAIGDRANRIVLNAFENVKGLFGEQGLRHRIEHAQVVDTTDISRFKELSIIASMQPTHATSDMNMAEERIGTDRMKGAYAWQRFLNQGTVIAAGSDFPVEHVNPFYGLHAAVTRQNHEGEPKRGWYAGQAMSRKQAFRAFTLDAAYAAYQEDILGSLEPGKWADFILVDRDYFEIPANEIWKINVLETWQAGQQVYDVSD